VSLILEALRKLDREKQTPERGFLVMAPAVWPSRDEGRRRWAWTAVAIAALVVLASAWAGRTPRERVWQAARPVPTAAAAAALVAAPVPALPVTAAPAPRLAAPFAAALPAATPRGLVAAAPALVLQAISERDGRPVALINDRLLREGDEIEGARLVKIDAASVEIEYQGRRMALHF
jgi:hypothetical protein